MNRAAKIAAIEATAESNGRTGSNGLYTREIVEGMEPSRIAAVLNAYVERLNVDAIADAKRKARRVALVIFLIGSLFGGGVVYFGIAVWMNPVRELLKHLPVVEK